MSRLVAVKIGVGLFGDWDISCEGSYATRRLHSVHTSSAMAFSANRASMYSLVSMGAEWQQPKYGDTCKSGLNVRFSPKRSLDQSRISKIECPLTAISGHKKTPPRGRGLDSRRQRAYFGQFTISTESAPVIASPPKVSPTSVAVISPHAIPVS